MIKHFKHLLSAKRTWLMLAFFGLAGGWMLHDLNRTEFKGAFHQADLHFLALIPIFYLLLYVLRTFRWQVLIGFPMKQFEIFLDIVALHNFWNNLMPAKTGEFSFLYLARKHAGVNLGYSAGLLLMVRLFDAASIFILMPLCLWLFNPLPEYKMQVTVLAACLLATILLAMLRMHWIVGHLTPWIKRKTQHKSWGKRVAGLIEKFEEGLRFCSNPLVLLKILGLSLGSNITAYTIFYIVLKSLNIDLSLPAVIVGSSITMFAAMLPIGAVGNVGPMDAGWVTGFYLLGVPKALGMASGILMHASILASIILLAVPAWLHLALHSRPNMAAHGPDDQEPEMDAGKAESTLTPVP